MCAGVNREIRDKGRQLHLGTGEGGFERRRPAEYVVARNAGTDVASSNSNNRGHRRRRTTTVYREATTDFNDGNLYDATDPVGYVYSFPIGNKDPVLLAKQ